jgi:hypothetical protein
MTTTTKGRATWVERLFGPEPAPAPQAPASDPDVVQAADRLGIPIREIQGLRDHPKGLIVDTLGVRYILLRDGEVDALGQGGVLVYDPDGTAPTLAMMPRYMAPEELSSSPWAGASFQDIAADAAGIACPLAELRSGDQVIAWCGGDPAKMASYWAASARAAEEPASTHARRNRMAAWARSAIVKLGILDVP